jgi:hypothetical protein
VISQLDSIFKKGWGEGGFHSFALLIDNFSIKPQHWFAQELTNIKFPTLQNKGVCVCCTLALPFTLLNTYLKAKRRNLWKLKYFNHAKNILFKKIL